MYGGVNTIGINTEVHNENISKEISVVLLEFHSLVFKLIKIAKKYEPTNVDIEWLKNKLSLARDLDPLMIITRAKNKIWHYRKQIKERDLDFFMNHKFKKFIKNDENKTFMYTLFNLIKKRFLELSENEQNLIWDLVYNLLICVAKYKKLTNDFNENN